MGLMMWETETITCNSWTEVEEIIGEKILQPQSLPVGYVLMA